MAGPRSSPLIRVSPTSAEAVVGAFQGLVAPAMDLAGIFNGLANTMKPFVEALNPAAVQVFAQAMRDLSAVIGVALEPVFQELTRVVREVGSALLPVTRELAPALGRLAQAVGSLVAPLVSQFADVLRVVVPFMSAVAQALSPLLRAVTVISQGLFALAASFLGVVTDDLNKAIDTVIGAIQQFAKWVVLAAGALASFFGATSMISGMIRALTPGPSVEGFAAPLNPAFVGFGDYGRQLALRSAVAGMGPGPRSTEDWLKEVVEGLKRIEATTPSFQRMMADELDKLWEKLSAFLKSWTPRLPR